MSTRRFAFIFGAMFLLIGIAGFVPQLMRAMHPEHPPLILKANTGQLFGLFPVNLLHDGVHLAFGAWGLAVSPSMRAARFYARAVAVIYFVLTIAGFVPGFMTGFGFVPLFGNDIWLHALLALIAAYVGWLHRDVVATVPS